DSYGNLVGINTVILSQSGDSAGIGFAIPINRIKKILPELIKTGKVLRPDFGWVLADTNQGPVVRRVFQNSPAEKSQIQGLEKYLQKGFVQTFYFDYESADLIFKVNGQRVNNKFEVEEIIEQLEPSMSLEFEFRRGGVKGNPKIIQITPVWR
ncbi:MAG: S1C family serine protease, partial [Candidatus Paceibacterota bacterium]